MSRPTQDLNPIEYCFHQCVCVHKSVELPVQLRRRTHHHPSCGRYKARLKREGILCARNPLVAHLRALDSVSTSNMVRYCHKVGYVDGLPAAAAEAGLELDGEAEAAVLFATAAAMTFTAAVLGKRRRGRG